MPSPSPKLRVLAATIAVAASATACGLKPAANDQLKAGAVNNAGGTAGSGAAAGANGAAGGGTTSGTLSGGGTTAGGGGLGGSSGGGGSFTGGGTSGTVGTGGSTGSNSSTNTSGQTSTGTRNTGGSGGGACGVPHGGNTTGITASTIRIGLHAPLTGTGTPFPNTSFAKGAGTYWQQPGHTICGRHVSVDFQDDTYKPSGAQAVCEQFAHNDFLGVGGGGTDQIQACATDSVVDSAGMPYLSAGVTDNGMTHLNNYFAVSLTYAQQGSLVLRNAQQQGFASPKASSDGKQWAIMTANTPNFSGARQGIESALAGAHISYQDFSKQINQNGNYQAAATQLGQQLALRNYRNIYVDLAPGYFVFMAKGYYNTATPALRNSVHWVGPGVTFTEVTVAQYLCEVSTNQVNGHAEFLAPFPGLDHSTADFRKAYNNKYDDIEWALWGLSQSIEQMLKQASNNLTRQNFIATVEKMKLNLGVYAPLDYADHGGHFGGTGAWVQKVSCGATEPDQNTPGTWTTVGSSYLRLY